MKSDTNIQDKINNFLAENKIVLQGGEITSEKQLSLVLNDLAKGDLEKGKIEKALYFAEKAIEFYEGNFYSYFIKGLIYRQLKKTKEAIESFEVYCKNSSDPLAYIYIGLSYAELNDVENALDNLRMGEKNISAGDSIFRCLNSSWRRLPGYALRQRLPLHKPAKHSRPRRGWKRIDDD